MLAEGSGFPSFGLYFASGAYAIPLVDLLIRTDRAEYASVFRHFIDGDIQGETGHAGIEMF